MTTLLPREPEYNDEGSVIIGNSATLTSKQEERERLQADMDAFFNRGGKVTHVDIGTTAVEIRSVGECVAQKRAAEKQRAIKGALTKRQSDARSYIDRRGECTLNDLKLYLKTHLTSARRTAEALESKRCIKIDGETLTSLRAKI